VQRRKQQDPRGPWDEDGSDYCHTSLLPRLSARLTRNFREISPPRTENPREPESRCRLTCRTESSRSNTTRMRPGSHVPVSFVSLLVTGTIAIPRISSFYPIAPGKPAGCRRTRRAKCYLPYRQPRAINAARFSRRFSRTALISRMGLLLPCCDSLILSSPATSFSELARVFASYVKCRRLSRRQAEFPLEEILPKIPLGGTRACPGEPLRPY